MLLLNSSQSFKTVFNGYLCRFSILGLKVEIKKEMVNCWPRQTKLFLNVEHDNVSQSCSPSQLDFRLIVGILLGLGSTDHPVTADPVDKIL